MDSISAQDANKILMELVQKVAQEKNQIRITSDEGNVVVLSEETYENILVTLELLSTPGLMESLNFSQNFELEEGVGSMHHASSPQISFGA